MIVWAIRHKTKNKYFVSFDGNGKAGWNANPKFSYKPETIWKNLKRLCGDFFYDPYKLRFCSSQTFYRKNWRNFDYTRLELYEVVEFDIKIIGNKVIQAVDFTNIEGLDKLETRIKS